MKQNYLKSWIFQGLIVIAVAIGLISFIHFKKRENIQINQPFAYVQLSDHPWLVHVQKNLEAVANQIIKDEVLKVNASAIDIPKFYIKKRNIITLLYSNSFSEALHEMIIHNIQSSLQALKTPASRIYFPNRFLFKESNHVDWFGRNNSELVVTIDDPEHCLSKIRGHILKGLKDSKMPPSDKSLYDVLNIKNANKFDFVPHESLGRIDVQKIEQLSNRDTVEKIKHTIAEALEKIIDEMTESNEAFPDRVELYGNDFKVIACMSVA